MQCCIRVSSAFSPSLTLFFFLSNFAHSIFAVFDLKGKQPALRPTSLSTKPTACCFFFPFTLKTQHIEHSGQREAKRLRKAALKGTLFLHRDGFDSTDFVLSWLTTFGPTHVPSNGTARFLPPKSTSRPQSRQQVGQGKPKTKPQIHSKTRNLSDPKSTIHTGSEPCRIQPRRLPLFPISHFYCSQLQPALRPEEHRVPIGRSSDICGALLLSLGSPAAPFLLPSITDRTPSSPLRYSVRWSFAFLPFPLFFPPLLPPLFPFLFTLLFLFPFF